MGAAGSASNGRTQNGFQQLTKTVGRAGVVRFEQQDLGARALRCYQPADGSLLTGFQGMAKYDAVIPLPPDQTRGSGGAKGTLASDTPMPQELAAGFDQRAVSTNVEN
jgi:hypothetical protein